MFVTGRNPVFEAEKAGLIKQVFIRKGARVYDINFTCKVSIIGRQEFEERFGDDAQGVAAEVPEFEYADFAPSRDRLAQAKGVVVLDRIYDPQNFGAIIRAAHCFGLRDIIVSRYQQAPVTAAVYKASAGSLFYMNIIQVTNIGRALDDLKELGYTVAAAVLDGSTDLREISAKPPIAMIIGSEGSGIREGVREKADIRLRIPMEAEIDSLNAAQSASVILYGLFSPYLAK